MKFRNVGQILLALVVSVGLGIGVTSCSNSYTVGYLYVTGSQYNQISGFNINNQTGKLTPIRKSPFGTNGSNPVRTLVLNGGRFLYVLNQGSFTGFDASGNPTGTPSNVSVFQVGGDGVLTFQASYTSQGNNSISMTTDSSGSHLYILDEYASPSLGTPCENSSGSFPVGDISAYNIDPNTGRLSLITNAQVTNPNGNGTQLTYFPLGCFPVEFKLVGGYIFTVQTGTTATNDAQTVFSYAQNTTNGQLTLTQNAPLKTGATKLTYINSTASGNYVYLLDAGPVSSCTGQQTAILPYTIGSGGILQSLVGGTVCNDPTAVGPVLLLVDAKSKFVYVANTTNTNVNQPASEISAFTIDPASGRLNFIAGEPFSTGSQPRCMLEDPTSQFIYTANFADSTVVGKIIDVNAGVLNPLRNATSFPTSGNPTWCAVSSRTQ
jgi:6-phosphogluconolactonase (cycloisomerase 2 family)